MSLARPLSELAVVSKVEDEVVPQMMVQDNRELSLAFLLTRSGELKQGLVDFAVSPRCERYLAKFVGEADDHGCALTDSEAINAIDRFALQYRLPNGDTVVDRFLASRPDLTAADRELLRGWRDPVEGIFERRTGPSACRGRGTAQRLLSSSAGGRARRQDRSEYGAEAPGPGRARHRVSCQPCLR